MQKEHTFTVDGIINGGAYIRVGLYPDNTIRLKMDVLISGGLKTGGGLKSGILRYVN